MLPIKFRVNLAFGSGDEAKNTFSRWRPWWPHWIFKPNDFSCFYVQVTTMLPTKFHVSWSFGSAKNRFSRWRPRRRSWISDRNDFTYFFFIYKSPRCSLPRVMSVGLQVLEMKRKIDFHDGGYLGFRWIDFRCF